MSDTVISGQAEGFGAPIQADSEPTINLYDQLGLPKDEPTIKIQKKLVGLKRDWGSKAGRSGTMAEKARTQLRYIADAEKCFADDQTRERYDLGLRAKPAGPEQEQEIDWLTRAWNYYFQRDEGAAAVAARKAREKRPNDQMVYVVSAWVKLLTAGVDKDEIKRAKEDADEAFVLDELGEDTADVHHVRAVVFLGLDDYDRGLSSIERALAKAVPAEKPHMYLVKGLLHQGKQEYEEMLAASIAGLEATPDISEEDQSSLTENLMAALTGLCAFPGSPDRSIAACEAKASVVRNSAIPQDSKNQALALLGNLKQIATLQKVKDVNFSLPNFPLKTLGIGILVVIIGMVAWKVLIVIGLAVLAFGAYTIYRRSTWNSQRQAYQTAQKQLSELRKSLPTRMRVIYDRKTSGELTVG